MPSVLAHWGSSVQQRLKITCQSPCDSEQCSCASGVIGVLGIYREDRENYDGIDGLTNNELYGLLCIIALSKSSLRVQKGQSDTTRKERCNTTRSRWDAPAVPRAVSALISSSNNLLTVGTTDTRLRSTAELILNRKGKSEAGNQKHSVCVPRARTHTLHFSPCFSAFLSIREIFFQIDDPEKETHLILPRSTTHSIFLRHSQAL